MTDLTNKTFADLRSIVEYNTEPENNAEAQEYADAWVEIARRAQANDAMRATLSNWCVQFGAALCPTAGSADSFGDGMRAAKKQVSRILAAAPTAASSGAPAPECGRRHANNELRCVKPVGHEGDHAIANVTWAESSARRETVVVAPAPADSQREAVIGSWRERMIRECEQGDAFSAVFLPTAARDLIDEAVSLMRSAPPAPVDQDAKLRDAVAALETVATKQQKVELRDAAHRILQGYSPCMNCGKWARRSECHWPCNPIGKAPPAPVAPVADGEVEAAIAVWPMVPICVFCSKVLSGAAGKDAAFATAAKHAVECAENPLMRERDEANRRVAKAESDRAYLDEKLESIEYALADDIKGEHGRVDGDSVLRVIARRVAEARGHGLRELRARLVDFCRIRDRGYDVRSDFSPLWVLDAIDRLLAAPPASKLAEEPAQEPKPSLSWRSIEPFVLRLVAAARVEGGNWMWNHLRKGDEAPTEGESQRCMDAVYAAVKALREQVESQARRIEALENNKEAGK